MWKLSETSVAVEVFLSPDIEGTCSLDGGEEAVCITVWSTISWLFLGHHWQLCRKWKMWLELSLLKMLLFPVKLANAGSHA